MSERNVISGDEWQDRWSANKTAWHRTQVNSSLTKYGAEVLRGLCGGEGARALVPLCGKSVDVGWLSGAVGEGGVVVGVEIAEKGIREFFSEQSLPFQEEPATKDSLQLFRTPDSKIQMYCGDIFNFQTPNPFDFIWDRAAMVAINVPDRAKYVTKLKMCTKPGSKILLATLNYDPAKHAGPPHNLSDEDVHKLFEEEGFSVKKVDEASIIDDEEHFRKNWGLDWLTETIFLITHN